MSVIEPHVGDLVPIEITVNKDDGSIMDLSTASAKDFVIRKPDGTKLTRAASFSGAGGTDGVLKYTLLESENDMAGIWRIQAIVTLPVIGTKHSTIEPIEIHPNL